MSRFQQLQGRRSGQAQRAGQPVVVLGHGFGTDQDAWAQLRPWLDENFAVISFNLAGCGPDGQASYEHDRHTSMFGYADDLTEILDELALGPCLYIGHSMSGMIGAVAAVARPDLFERLVMIGASPRYLNDGVYTGGFTEEGLNQLFAAMAANYQAWVTGFAPMVVGVDSSATVADFSRTLFQMRSDIALNISRTIFGSDLRHVVPQVPHPVVLIQTADDVAVPTAVGEWLRAALPQASLDVIAASGHLPHMTAAAEVRRILENRLKDLL